MQARPGGRSAGVTQAATPIERRGARRRRREMRRLSPAVPARLKARAVFAGCKTGPDRDNDIGRLDGTIEDINGAIAESCSVQ
jgi:hypothetical protein